MKSGPIHAISLTIAFLGLASCNEDPELVRKSEQQKFEIAKLKSEISLIEARLEDLPADLQAQIDQAAKNEKKQTAEIDRLEDEVAKLTQGNRELRKQFEAYQLKYRLNKP